MAAAEDAGRLAFGVSERAGVVAREWPVTAALPLADGQLRASTVEQGHIRVLRPDGVAVPSQARVSARWGAYPWGASAYARFVQVTFLADLQPLETAEYVLEWGPLIAPPAPKPLSVRKMIDAVVVRSGQGENQLMVVIEGADYHSLFETIVLDQKGDGFADDLPLVGPGAKGSVTLARSTGRAVTTTSLAGPAEVTILEDGPVRARIEARSQFGEDLVFTALYTFYAGQPYVFVEATLSALGSGEADAIEFGAYGFALPLEIAETADVTCGTGDALNPDLLKSDWTTIEPGKPVYLRQDAPSEGAEGQWHYSFGRGLEEKASGNRAPGWMDIHLLGRAVMVACKDFWLGGSRSMEASEASIRVNLVPEQGADGGRTLSRGESLTTDLLFCFPYDRCLMPSADVAAAFIAPVIAAVRPQAACASQAYSSRVLRAVPSDIDPLAPAIDVLLGRTEPADDKPPVDGVAPLGDPVDIVPYSTSLRSFELSQLALSSDGGSTHDLLQALVEQHARTGDQAALDLAMSLGRRLSRSASLDDLAPTMTAGLTAYVALSDDVLAAARIADALTWRPGVHPQQDPATSPAQLAAQAQVDYNAWRFTWDAAWIDSLAVSASAFSAHLDGDGVWWGTNESPEAICPAESDSITMGLQGILAAELSAETVAQIDAAIIARADLLLDRGIEHEAGFLNNRYQLRRRIHRGLVPASAAPQDLEPPSAGFEAMLTMATAYRLTGEDRYREATEHLLTAGLAGLRESPAADAAAAALLSGAPALAMIEESKP